LTTTLRKWLNLVKRLENKKGVGSVRLTFENRTFILRLDNMSQAPIPPAGWECVKAFEYTTKKLSAAARFKTFADDKAEKIFKTRALIDLPLPSGGLFTPPGLSLFKFQIERGVPHILGHNKSYLAHAPGLGKSAQAITAVSKKPGRTLIICPAFLKTTWAREITKWFIGDFPSISVVANTSSNMLSDFLIVSDALLSNEVILSMLQKQKFRHVIIDEVHRFKTLDASRTTALFGGRNKKLQSLGLIYKSEHCTALSGTPMLNRPIELWPVLSAMAPETIDFMTFEEFGFKYCAPTRNQYGWLFLGSSNESELSERITNKFMQVIKKEDVLPDLPTKVREVISMTLDPRDLEIIQLDKIAAKKFQSKPDLDLGEYAELRQINGVSKINWVSAFVADILKNDPNESILLYAHHREVVSGLAFKLSEFLPLLIQGGVDSKYRTLAEDSFQSGRSRLIIGNISAMSLGLTLTRATRVVFAEYDWTPAANIQAEDRANRIGSKWSIFCQYIVLPNSIDEDILNANILKQERIEKVIK
jgi:SWI/SNF-related matrix-associated actin-dependent regulator 1 of chromatin subfamily A